MAIGKEAIELISSKRIFPSILEALHLGNAPMPRLRGKLLPSLSERRIRRWLLPSHLRRATWLLDLSITNPFTRSNWRRSTRTSKIAPLKKWTKLMIRSYRYFNNINRLAAKFPVAHTANTKDEVDVWCANDYLGMGRNPVVLDTMK